MQKDLQAHYAITTAIIITFIRMVIPMAGHIFITELTNISSFSNADWSTATRVISSPLMDNAIVRVAKAKDMDRWAVIYNGYREIDVNVYQQDIFVQYTQNMNTIGSGGISSLTLYDSFFDVYACGVSQYGLGLSASANDIYTQQYYMTDPYGALDIPGSSSIRGGLLTWADGTSYGNNVYWAGWTTSFPSASYFIPPDIDR